MTKHLFDYIEKEYLVEEGDFTRIIRIWKPLPQGLEAIKVPDEALYALQHTNEFPFPYRIIDQEPFYWVVVRADTPKAFVAIVRYRTFKLLASIYWWFIWKANQIGIAETPIGACMSWKDLKPFKFFRSIR